MMYLKSLSMYKGFHINTWLRKEFLQGKQDPVEQHKNGVDSFFWELQSLTFTRAS